MLLVIIREKFIFLTSKEKLLEVSCPFILPSNLNIKMTEEPKSSCKKKIIRVKGRFYYFKTL